MEKMPLSPVRHVTLLNLMVPIVVFGVLASIVTTLVMNHLAKARITLAKAQIQEFIKALDYYQKDTGSYPTDNQGLRILTEANKGKDPYIASIPHDPWGYVYLYKSSDSTFEIVALGADGREGGTGEDEDIKVFGVKPKQRR